MNSSYRGASVWNFAVLFLVGLRKPLNRRVDNGLYGLTHRGLDKMADISQTQQVSTFDKAATESITVALTVAISKCFDARVSPLFEQGLYRYMLLGLTENSVLCSQYGLIPRQVW